MLSRAPSGPASGAMCVSGCYAPRPALVALVGALAPAVGVVTPLASMGGARLRTVYPAQVGACARAAPECRPPARSESAHWGASAHPSRWSKHRDQSGFGGEGSALQRGAQLGCGGGPQNPAIQSSRHAISSSVSGSPPSGIGDPQSASPVILVINRLAAGSSVLTMAPWFAQAALLSTSM